ncbi:M23 family metallopeptidase [Streptomyces viridodiastaticus]|uniref:M23 family metallopeptidase n=1 Tax=Streptomyces albogriseolus TaxID=1887 RepID=UPI0016784AE9|nr:M23 family metallopeptidase [Streptomyces viridodiastaticus]MCX4570698.1 M23 family metallopeptidase [Streptomyces viridodiastaticus]
MSQRSRSRNPGSSLLRTRAAVIAVGLGASAVLGVGTAVAAQTGKTASALPGSVTAQAAEKAAKKAPSWVAPVKKYKLTAGYAQTGSRWSSTHSGQDFAVPLGSPVGAVRGGTVVKAGPNGGGDGPAYGNAIVIKHANGTYSQYAHLSRIDVKAGQTVKTGQTIARSGNTGNSSGPHLHLEIRTSPNFGTAINPLAFLRSQGLNV